MQETLCGVAGAPLGTATVAALLAVASAPSLAGNYAEGDPRPMPLTSSTTRATVAADAQQWLNGAPTQGYTDGISQQAVAVSANTRAAVAADTRQWIQSGLAAQQNGEAGADMARPAYRQAVAEYTRLRASPPMALWSTGVQRAQPHAAAH